MDLLLMRAADIAQRAWFRQRGEQPLLVTSWPRKFQRGDVMRVNNRSYRTTRYLRAGNPRYCEVWGRPVGARAYPIVQQPETHGPTSHLS